MDKGAFYGIIARFLNLGKDFFNQKTIAVQAVELSKLTHI